jgi:hypothetical protein
MVDLAAPELDELCGRIMAIVEAKGDQDQLMEAKKRRAEVLKYKVK